jgi:hypothetical protein
MLRKLFASLVFCLALTACETIPSAGIDDKSAMRPANAGAMAVQVFNNSRYIGVGLTLWDELFVVELKPNAELIRVPMLANAAEASSVFVAALPPGRYRLVGLGAFAASGNVRYSANVGLDLYLGTFSVREGELTNLGTLITQPLESTANGIKFVAARTNDVRDVQQQAIERLSANGLNIKAMTQGFEPDPFQPLHDALAREFKNRGLPRDAIRLQGGTELLAFGRLGRIHIRREMGWQSQDLPTNAEMYAGLQTRAGTVWLGGENGTLVRLDATLKQAEKSQPFASDVVVTHLNVLPNGTLIATLRTKTEWQWHSGDKDGKNWRKEYAVQRKNPGYFFSTNAVHTLVRDNEYLAYNEKLLLRRTVNAEWRAEPTTREWLQLKLQPNQWLLGQPYEVWNGADAIQLSRDLGKTWLSNQQTKSTKWGMFKRVQVAYVFDDQTLLVQTSKFGNYELSRVGPKGEITALGGATGECSNFMPHISVDQSIYFGCDSGNLLLSRDRGATYSVDFVATFTSTVTTPIIERELRAAKANGSLDEFAKRFPPRPTSAEADKK